jgi:hypothetical protein
VAAYWTFPPIPGNCINEGISTLIGGCVKTFTDLLITTLPIPLIMRMNMTKHQRYGICILLGLGYFVTAAGALRTYFTYKVFFGGNYDQTWTQYPAFLASAVENDIAVITACIPALRPLLQPLFGPPLGSIKSKFRNLTGQLSNNSKDTISQLSRVREAENTVLSTKYVESSTEKKLVIEKRQSFELKEYPANDSEMDYTD